MTVQTTPEHLRLEPIAGPPLEPILVDPSGPVTLGRSGRCDVRLPEDQLTVSRRHARLVWRGGKWLVRDLASSHGTTLNDVRLAPEQPTELEEGDRLRIGPWTFLVGGTRSGPARLPTIDDLDSRTQRVEHIAASELGVLARQRLTLLMDFFDAAMRGAQDRQTLYESTIDAALAGTGFSRGALVRWIESSAEVIPIAQRLEGGRPAPAFAPPRSILRAAAAGQVVRLSDQSQIQTTESISRLGIDAAMCSPLEMPSTSGLFLYLDVAGRAVTVRPDAATFVMSVARMCGMAVANMERHRLTKKQEDLIRDLEAAREAQQRMMPPTAGRAGPLEYRMCSLPGRMVAGDLFDVVAMPGGRVGVFLGDVKGKGLGAAFLMAVVQSYLRSTLRTEHEPSAALHHVAEFLETRSDRGDMITLWLGVFDPARGALSFVDAGHGYIYAAAPGESLARLLSSSGIPLNVEPSFRYHAETVPIRPGFRLLMFSDGVNEQRGGEEGRFGEARALAAVEAHADPGAALDHLVGSLRGFAGADALDDDVTAALVRFDPA